MSSGNINFPLSMPFEYNCSPESSQFYPIQAVGFYDAKFLFVLKGELLAAAGGEELSLKAGDVLVICPDTEFTLSAVSEETPAFRMIRLDPNQLYMQPYTAGLKAILREARKQKMPMRIPANEAAGWRAFDLEEICFQEYQEKAFGWETMALAQMYQICTGLVRCWRSHGMDVPDKPADEEPIYSITAYIHQHIQDGIRVEELANRCNLSYPWFAKRFREIYAVSCKEYIEQVRVVRVEQYLRYTDWDLTEISELTGYADCSHMIKNFKRMRNTTPGQYRLSHKA